LSLNENVSCGRPGISAEKLKTTTDWMLKLYDNATIAWQPPLKGST
jgi:hypothetical protein